MCKTTALHVHHAFQYISLTPTARLRREASLCDFSWRTWKYDDKFSFLYLNIDKALKNLTPGKVACICRVERFQMDAIKIERTQILFSVMFSLPSSSSMRKVPITTRTIASRKKTESGFNWPNKMSGDSECRQKTYEVIKDVNSKIVMPKAILFYIESIKG